MLKMSKFITRLIFFFLIIHGVESPASAEPDYVIGNLEATFEIMPGPSDKPRNVSVDLDITYNILDGPKSGGFKFVGKNRIGNVRVLDGNGNPLVFNLEKQKEYLISWNFPPVNRGFQYVNVHFVMRNAFLGSLEENWCDFKWLKNWQVPVHNVVFRYVLPDDFETREFIFDPSGGEIVPHGDGYAMEIHLEQLQNRYLSLRFSPGMTIADSSFRNLISPGMKTMTLMGMLKYGLNWLFYALCLAAIVKLVVFLITSAMSSTGGGHGNGHGGCGGGGCGGGGGGGGCGG